MTNEQTAIVLDGYASLLQNAIHEAKNKIEPTEKENIIQGKHKAWPELYELDDVLSKLNVDINALRPERIAYGGFQP